MANPMTKTELATVHTWANEWKLAGYAARYYEKQGVKLDTGRDWGSWVKVFKVRQGKRWAVTQWDGGHIRTTMCSAMHAALDVASEFLRRDD